MQIVIEYRRRLNARKGYVKHFRKDSAISCFAIGSCTRREKRVRRGRGIVVRRDAHGSGPQSLLGNYFVHGWNWPPGAFVLVGTLLFGIGLTYELVTRNRDGIAYRGRRHCVCCGVRPRLGERRPMGRRHSCRRDVFRGPHCGGHRCRRGALAAKWHGSRLVRHRARSSFGPGRRADYTDCSKSSGYLLDTA